MLDSNQKLIDPFFTRGRQNDSDVYYLSQSYGRCTTAVERKLTRNLKRYQKVFLFQTIAHYTDRQGLQAKNFSMTSILKT